MIDWAIENGLTDRRDSTQVEFAWLADITGKSLPIWLQISDTNLFLLYQRFTLGFLAGSPVHDGSQLALYLSSLPLGSYSIDEFISAPIVAHDVMFATDFGNRTCVQADEAIAFLQSDIEQNDREPEWHNECAIALKMLGVEVELKQPTSELSWATYHDHLVYEIARNL